MKQEYITIISKRIKKKIRTEGSPHAMIGAVFFNDSRGSYQASSWRPAPSSSVQNREMEDCGIDM